MKIGTNAPALLLKIMLLGALNAFTVWSVPILISNKSWFFAIYFVLSTLILDFIFLSDWTNFFEWKSFCEENKIEIYQKLDDLNH